VKQGVLHILNDFVLGHIDVSRLNFGIMSMIPEVPGVDQISQYRPVDICYHRILAKVGDGP
jgi:hypothetical protein